MFTAGRQFSRCRTLISLFCGLIVIVGTICPNSADAQGEDEPSDGQPWITFLAMNVDQLVASAETLLEANNSPELTEILHEQVDFWLADSKGLHRKRLLGWMQFWPQGEEAGAEVLLLPVTQPEELLKFIAGETAPFRQLTPHHTIIERGDSPYHVWFEDQTAWLGNTLATLKSMASRRDWSRQLGTHDAAIRIDFRQIPPLVRDQWAASTSQMLAAFIQQRDGESEAGYAVRKVVGQKLLDWLAALPTDVNFVELAFELQPPRQRILVDLTVDVRPDSSLVALLSRWKLGTSSLAKLSTNPDGLLTAFINLPAFAEDRNAPLGEHKVICIVEGLDLDSRTVVFGYVPPASGPSSRATLQSPAGSPEKPLAQGKALPPTGEKAATAGADDEVERTSSASFERVTLGDEHLWWRRWLKTNSVGVRQENEYGIWWAFGYEDGSLATLDRLKELLAKPQSSSVTGGLGVKLSPTFLAALLETTPPVRGSQPPEGEEPIELRTIPTGVPSRFTVRLILPAGVLAQFGRPLAAELSEQLEHRIQSNFK